ncbi:hypothetical protein RND71_043633 [Anisodus tanguticus]|uniref:Uncharacterized protein n=1 Tax=Anisodus tanguticus TaxID=243964 RepID=A0AAE1QR49_9SOLA|nr:hypothetical protein RND71_043633 [Anisodus tanguticus]
MLHDQVYPKKLELPPRNLDTNVEIEADKFKDKDNLPDNLITIENNQKWDSFYETIEEIKSNLEYSEEPVTIFVLVEFDRTIDKLEKILDKGSKSVLKEMNDRKKLTFNELLEEMKIENEIQNLEQNTKEDNIANLNLSISTQTVKLKDEIGLDQEVQLNIIFHSFKDGSLVFENMLYSYKPKYTIFYDYNISCIRLLEVYQAAICSPNKCFIYLLIFDGSAEEQKYFSNLRSEKESFERLINEKRNMVIPVERDGKNGLNLDLVRGGLDFENIEEQSHRDQQQRTQVTKQGTRTKRPELAS